MGDFDPLTPKEQKIQKVIVTIMVTFGTWVIIKLWIWEHIKYPLIIIENNMNQIWETYKHDIIKGFFTGIFGGIGVFIIKAIWDAYVFWKHERRICAFFRKNTSFNHYTTHRLSSSVDLPESRVAYVCGSSKKIKRNERESETWALK